MSIQFRPLRGRLLQAGWAWRRALALRPFALRLFALRPPGERRWLWLIWAGVLLGGVALAAWAGVADRLPGDLGVGQWTQEHDPFGREALGFLRDVGSSLAALVTILLLSIAAWVAGRRWTAAAALAFLLGLLLETVLKEVVDRPRPTAELLEPLVGFRSSSFPSGHVMSTLLAGALVLWLVRRCAGLGWLRVLPAVWAGGLILLQPWVSVAGGVHWPSDVLGGLVWGLVVVIPGVWLLNRAWEREQRAATLRGGCRRAGD